MAEDRAEALAARVLAGIAHLRANRPEAAAVELRVVATDEELAAAEDLRDVRARACSLLAQSLQQTGRPEEASRWCQEALRLARALEDEDGLKEIQSLYAEIRSAMGTPADRRLAEALAGLPIASVVAGLATAAERAEALIRKANASLDHADPDSGAMAARLAVAEAVSAADVRLEVLARMSLARAEPDRAAAELLEAFAVADRNNAFNLVAGIARSAELLGVPLPTQHGATPVSELAPGEILVRRSIDEV